MLQPFRYVCSIVVIEGLVDLALQAGSPSSGFKILHHKQLTHLNTKLSLESFA